MEPGKQRENYFFSAVPESAPGGRQPVDKASPLPRPERPSQPGMTGGELRLRVWQGLPERHRNEVCKQIRKRCEAFISSLRMERGERQPQVDQLVSEVVAHLLRAASVRWDENADR